jgi:hypothetical protein
MIIGSLGEKYLTEPFTDGLAIVANRQMISSFEGENWNLGMIWDRTASANKKHTV